MTSLIHAYQYMRNQYALIQEARAVLLDYCEQMTPTDFVREHPSFGRGGSIRNLLVHVVNTYQFWIGKHASQKDFNFTSFEDIQVANQLRVLFNSIDQQVEEFMNQCQQKEIFQISLNNKVCEFTSIQLFTHIISHEFHHKGQILSISRHWGYVPVDTDIIRP